MPAPNLNEFSHHILQDYDFGDVLNPLHIPLLGAETTLDSLHPLSSPFVDDSYHLYPDFPSDASLPTTSSLIMRNDVLLPAIENDDTTTVGLFDASWQNAFSYDTIHTFDELLHEEPVFSTSSSANYSAYQLSLPTSHLPEVVAEAYPRDNQEPTTDSKDDKEKDWKQQPPTFQIDLPPKSPNVEIRSDTRRRRRRRRTLSESSPEPKRSKQNSALRSSMGRFRQEHHFAHSSLHPQVRTVPSAIPVEDLCLNATQEGTRKKRASSLSQERHSCELCFRSFQRLRDIPRHMKAVHSSQEERFFCMFCHRSYSRSDSLKRHTVSCKKSEIT